MFAWGAATLGLPPSAMIIGIDEALEAGGQLGLAIVTGALPLSDGLLVDAMALGQRAQGSLDHAVSLDGPPQSCGRAGVGFAPRAVPCDRGKFTPSHAGTKH